MTQLAVYHLKLNHDKGIMQKSEENTQTNQTTAGEVKSKIVQAYRDYMLEHGMPPASIYSFCQSLSIGEEEFYEHFNQFDQVEEAYWQMLLEDLWVRLDQSPDYVNLSVREKMLTFYFEFFSVMRQHRSFFLLSYDDSWPGLGTRSNSLDGLRKVFSKWAERMVQEGLSTNEISGRSRLSETYDRLFWFQFLFLLNFWKRDRSTGFEKTDAAIEKSVNLSFDLIEKNAIDSALDFGKFMFQNR